MRSRLGLRPLLAVAAVLSLSTCTDQFPFAPDEGGEAEFHVRIEPVDWPDSLRIGESTTLAVRLIETGTGKEIATAPGLTVSWSVDGAGIILEDPTGLDVTAEADGTGEARPVVSVSGEAVADATYSSHVIDVLAAGVAIELPPGDTMLDARGDTMTLVARGLDVNGDPVDHTGVEWSLSGNAAALELLETEGDTVRAAVTGIGADTVYASHGACEGGTGAVCEAHVLVTVDPVAVAMAAAADTVLLDALGATDTAAVVFSDRNGFPVPGVAARWSLVEAADSVVVTLDTLNGAVTALAAGVADVAVTSAVGDDTMAVKVHQTAAHTGIVPDTALVLEGVGTTDTLRVVPTDSNGHVLERSFQVSWSSTDTLIVRADPVVGDSATGVLTVIGFGDAWVFADVEGATDSVSVTATGVVARVDVSPSEVTVTQITARPQVDAAAFDSLGNQIPNAPFTWSSADPAIAEVSPAQGDSSIGVIEPVADEGTTTITATSGAFSDDAQVTIDLVTSFSCDAGGGTEHQADTLTASETWTRDGSPHYLVGGEIVVDGQGTVLTVEPGALVCSDYGAIRAENGGRVEAVGTADDRILFTLNRASGNDRWSGFWLRGAPGDTSRLAHVVIEQAWGGVRALDDHPVVILNSLISQTHYNGALLEAAGSRIVDSRVEQTNQYDGVRLGNRTRFERTTVNGAARHGVATVNLWDDTVAVVGGRIEGSGDVGLKIGGAHLTEAAPVRVTGGRSYPVEATWDNIRMLYPTLADQDSLLGNQLDQIGLSCSRIHDGTATVRSDLPWRINCWVEVDSVARMEIQPGSTIRLVNGAFLEFFDNATLEALGTAADPITFTSLDPNSYAWQRISFESDPAADTSRIRHAVVEHSDLGVRIAPGAAPVVLDSSRIRQSERRALEVFPASARIADIVVDTTIQPDALSAVAVGQGVLLEDITIRDAAGLGLEAQGDSARLRNLRILGSGGVGLLAEHRLAEATGIRITGGDSYPARLSLEALHAIAPTRAAQDSLLGNAKDTLVVNGSRLVGEIDVFGNPTAVDTLVVRSDMPWRVAGHAVFDSATVHVVEPGATLAFEEGGELRYSNGGTLAAEGTEADPILLTAADPAKPWRALDIDAVPDHTSTIRHATLEYAGASSSVAVYVHSDTRHPPTVFLDHVRVRQSANRAIEAGWVDLQNVVVDTTHGTDGGSAAAVLLGHDVTVDSMTVRSVEGMGILVTGHNPVLKHIHIDGTGDIGLDVSATALDSAADIRITGAGSYPVRATLDNLHRIAPTAADQADLLGSAKDTLIVVGGQLKGELDVFGNPSAVDTMVVPAGVPWRMDATPAIDSAAVLLMEPGAHVAFGQGVGLEIRQGQLRAEGTAPDPVVLTATHPLEPWWGLYFAGDAPDTSYVRHTRVAYTGSSPGGYSAIENVDGHPIVLEHVVVKRPSGGPALDLNGPGTRALDVYVDSATTSTGNHGVVDLGSGVAVDSLTVFRPEADGVAVIGDSVTLRDVRVDGALGVGLRVEGDASLKEASHVVVTNGASYGVRAPPEALHALAPTREAQDSLMGNARDTLVILDGSLKGELDAFDNVTAVDTLVVRPDLPWRLSGNVRFDSASLMVVEPGASVTLDGSVLLQFSPGRLLAEGTEADTILFRAAHPLEQWAGLLFQRTPADTSRLSYVRVEDSSGMDRPHPAVSTSASHPITLHHVVIKRSEGWAVELGAPGSRMVDVTVDTITGDNAEPAVKLSAAVTLENTVIRGARTGGLEVDADSVRLVGLSVLESAGYGLQLSSWVQPDTLADIRVTGGQGVPFRGPVQALAMLDQDSLTGNVRDTLVLNGGTVRGEIDGSGTITRIDTLFARPILPWRVEGGVVFDSASALYAEPGALVTVDGSARIDFEHGRLLSMGTAADPVRFGPASTGQTWHGLYLYGNPGDTSYVRNTIIEYAGRAGWEDVAVTGTGEAPLVIDSTVIRQSATRALVLGAQGSRITRSVIDTTHSTPSGVAAVELTDASTSMHGTVVRGAAGVGVFVANDEVTVDSSEITLSGMEGMQIGDSFYLSDPATVTVEYCNFVDNAGIGMENFHSVTMDATNNWWGDADGPEGANGDGVGANITFDPWLGAAVSIPWYRPGGP